METAIQSTAPPASPIPRKRRRWPRVLAIGVTALIAVPLLLFFISGWFGERELQRIYAEIEAEDPNWQWADLLAEGPPAPEHENAFTQIRKVKTILKQTPFTIANAWNSESKEKARRIRNARISEENMALVRAAFAPLDPKVLPEARKLKDFTKGRMKIDPATNPFELLLEEVHNCREVMYVLDCDILVRTADQDFEGAVESWQALMQTSRAIEDNPTLIGQLVRIAGQAIALGALERMLAQGEWSDADLVKIQAMLNREANENLLYYGLRGERAAAHRVYQDIRDGKFSLSKLAGGMKGGPTGVLDNTIDMFPSLLLRGYPDHLRLFNEQVRASKLQDGERLAAMHEIEQKVRNSRNLFTRLIMPASTKVAEASHRIQAQTRCAIVAIAAERYRLKHRAWPIGYDDLVKERFLDAIPNDPFDGKSLRFKRTPTGLLFYSVGLDKIDNQGNVNRDSPYTPGTDLGFEVWDVPLRALQPPVEEENE